MSRRTVWICFGVLALSGALAAYAYGRQASARSESPLAAYPGFGHHPRADELRYKGEERRREELIASCMRKHGFVYSPSPSLEPESSSVMPDRAGPNEHYVGSLTPSRQRAYWLALEGTADPSDESGLSKSGCLQDAHAAIPGVYAAANALREPYEDLQDAIASDQRIDDAERRWSSCMRSAGYSYATPRDLVAAGDTASPPATHDAALEAGEACRRDVDLAATYADVTVEHETRFVERYRDVLEKYR